MQKLSANSNILYVRASLKPLLPQIKAQDGVVNFLKSKIDFKEIIVPHFYGARPFWQRVANPKDNKTNSGALGKSVREMDGSVLSHHPTHAFVGIGPRIENALKHHNENAECFEPMQLLAEKDDFSMLLVGCTENSPGFSTVHASQELLGLTEKHLERYLLRWDYLAGNEVNSKIAPESPGCSKSFGKFYEYYRQDNNFLSGEWDSVKWVYVKSAVRAIKVETEILTVNPRFVDCGNFFCTTCNFRMY